MTGAADLLDGALELTVVGSFSRVGALVRSRTDDWEPDGVDLSGRTIVLTGATSGIGAAAARRLASLHADLILLARSADKAERSRQELSELGTGTTSIVLADMSEPDQVRDAAAEILSATDTIDVLVHNAGALGAQRRENSRGTELTVAAQVDGPFLLTSLLLEALRAARPGRVITMSSGGMYTQPLSVTDLEMGPEDYRGSVAYARAKRAQVTLNELWAERIPPGEVVFHALHPGWADTPGVESSLPTFHRVLRPLLRTPEEGAATLVWLASDDGEPRSSSGAFWHDRRPRPTHLLGRTRASDNHEAREALWRRCEHRAGIESRTAL